MPAAAAEQEKLKSEIAATMASLNDLDTEAQSVMSQQQEMEAQQQEQEAVLAEVTGRREKQQGEVRVCVTGHLAHPGTWLVVGQ